MIDGQVELQTQRLKDLRAIALGISQAQMASWMSMPLRTYEDLEKGRAKVRGTHMLAAQMATFRAYLAIEDATLPSDLLELAQQVIEKHQRVGL